jgi:outer membrane receptor protein involved in Fe transport
VPSDAGWRRACIAWPATRSNEAPGRTRGRGNDTRPDPNSQDQGLQEIVITARKFQETLSDAPVSVSAVTSDSINELGLNSIEDFARQATGLSFSQAFGRSTDRPVIRGQSNVLAGVQAGVETGAAFFVDGVYYQGDIQGFDPQSIERVEIIKGPQSALYGRNTYAGAINYITKDPSEKFSIGGRAGWRSGRKSKPPCRCRGRSSRKSSAFAPAAATSNMAASIGTSSPAARSVRSRPARPM